jgi:hypothetical protein
VVAQPAAENVSAASLRPRINFILDLVSIARLLSRAWADTLHQAMRHTWMHQTRSPARPGRTDAVRGVLGPAGARTHPLSIAARDRAGVVVFAALGHAAGLLSRAGAFVPWARFTPP